ncbi:MAG: DNA polymerase I [Bacteroidales bacterium]|nr:DNA polymerase I [Bacteroidales bacterium]
MPDKSPSKLFLLDAYALIYRSYYAFIRNPRINTKGFNTSAVFGFVLTLEEIMQKQNPSHLAVVFDPPSPTFRHEMYKEYKANRDATPEDIKLSVPYIKSLIKAFNIPIYEVPGFEADDVIGTLSWKASDAGIDTFMMTPDKDFAQLVRDNVKMFKPARGGAEPVVWGPKEVCEEFMIDDPLKVIDVLALMGDSADNVPGAPGIGPKTAKKLINEFGSVEELLANTDKLKGKQKESLENNSELVLFSKKLVTIDTAVPVDFKFEDMERKDPDKGHLKAIYEELEFRSMAAKLDKATASSDAEPAKATVSANISPSPSADPFQGSLFGDSPLEVRQVASSLADSDHEYILLKSKDDVRALKEKLEALDEFCFDTETTSLDVLTTELVGIAFSWEKAKGYFVWLPVDKDFSMELLEMLRPVFENEKIVKIGHNLKFDEQVLKSYGLEVKGSFFDTMLAHYLLEPDMRHKMDYLSETYLEYKPEPIENLIGEKGKNQRTMRNVEQDRLKEYAVEDADITYRLKEIFEKKLQEQDLHKLAAEIEMPLIRVLGDMERTGVALDEQSLKDYAVKLREDILGLEKEIHILAGIDFNISSPKQLGDILFLRLKLDDKAKKTKTKQFSTNEETLVRLADKHPIINLVLEFRGLKKLLSTYVETLPELINRKTGRIHTSYNQAVAATGRLSSNNPNLQNIPIRDASGREIRKAFIPANGKIYFSADYSQIELRLMAHLSGDKGMLSDFRDGEDIHAATAAKIFGVKKDEVSREMRTKAKTANFGIIYGISAFGLGQRLNIPRTEAKALIDGYFQGYPGVKDFMDRSIELARENGYVTTMFGRRRYLRDINSRNAMLRSNAERNAINAPIQGSAADIIKVAMINIYKKLEEGSLNAKMILQVHDELIFEVLESDLESLKAMVIEEMESAVKLKVPLIVDYGTGTNWLEAH